MFTIKAIPTTYKGIKLKSRLEGDMALLLDKLKLRWEYEKESFLLPSGTHYWPDFYLPELNTYIETKGVITQQVIKTMKEFVLTKRKPIILVSKRETLWFGSLGTKSETSNGSTVFFDIYDPNGTFVEEEDLHAGFCSNCNKFFFCGNIGSYHCRACGEHNGDHDIILLPTGMDELRHLADLETK